jgi:Fe(3+) dicitrate transport protein
MCDKKIGMLCLMMTAITTQAQQQTADSTVPKYLPDVTVVGKNSRSDVQLMPEIVGTSIYAGKKSTLLVLDNVKGNVVTNTMRQVMAKVPGIQIWESDGSGIQIGIAARGLSPNRSWEFNTRQNGYDIAADPFGYPEAYYNPQLQAVQRIEIVRGQGALQYGPQFGGMINYVLRNGSDINKPFAVETQQTVGSNGLFNTYNAIGGETKKFHYYAFFDHRQANGWRQNSRYYTNAGFGTFTWKINRKLSVGAEIMQSHIRSQQPGGLTDAQLLQDARQSFRQRNWFDILWTTTAVTAQYAFTDNARMTAKVFGIFGDRSSIGYLKPITTKDSINPATQQYDYRTVDIDRYRNWGAEIRMISDYKLGGKRQTIAGGVRYFKGNTDRFKNGKGNRGEGYSNAIEGIYPQDIDMTSQNAAIFVENVFYLGKKLLLIPGVRMEYLETTANGRLNLNTDGSANLVNNEKRTRRFVVAGIGAEYHLTKETEVYANLSQAYRPMLFSDLTYSPTTDVVDADLKDAKGYNADLGYRGKLGGYLLFDFSFYHLQYDNRIGTITQQAPNNTFYSYRTNVGNSRSRGVEALVEFNPIRAFCKPTNWGTLNLFVSYSYNDARYNSLRVVTKNASNQLVETNLRNKKVENAPEHIFRGGITWMFKTFSLTGQWSHVSKSYSDANNTEIPTSNGQVGVIPAYTVSDLTASWEVCKHINLKAGINNLGNSRYFTRRSGGYPGPGLLPSDGRSAFVSVGAKF